jgi:hypothetical protein
MSIGFAKGLLEQHPADKAGGSNLGGRTSQDCFLIAGWAGKPMGHAEQSIPLSNFFLRYSDRPFRGSSRRGGEDSCGGF